MLVLVLLVCIELCWFWDKTGPTETTIPFFALLNVVKHRFVLQKHRGRNAIIPVLVWIPAYVNIFVFFLRDNVPIFILSASGEHRWVGCKCKNICEVSLGQAVEKPSSLVATSIALTN